MSKKFLLHDAEYILNTPVEKIRVCCNCAHCIRTGKASVRCHCEIDDQYLGYISVMEGWCCRWKTNKKRSDKNEQV